MSDSAKAKLVIVGGAIMGSFAAWSLRREGFAGEITVIEKDPTYQFSSTALSAASIRTQFGTPVNIRMSLYGVDFFRRIKESFGPSADIGYVENGYLILGGPETAAARRTAVEMQRAEGADVIALTPRRDRGPLSLSCGRGSGHRHVRADWRRLVRCLVVAVAGARCGKRSGRALCRGQCQRVRPGGRSVAGGPAGGWRNPAL